MSEWSSDEYDDSLPLEVSAKMAEAVEKSAKKKSKSMDKDRVKVQHDYYSNAMIF